MIFKKHVTIIHSSFIYKHFNLTLLMTTTSFDTIDQEKQISFNRVMKNIPNFYNKQKLKY